jgi:hypothetical protein
MSCEQKQITVGCREGSRTIASVAMEGKTAGGWRYPSNDRVDGRLRLLSEVRLFQQIWLCQKTTGGHE